MIEELKEQKEVYTRELISSPQTVCTVEIRYRNNEIYLIQFKVNKEGKGWAIESGTDSPLESFMILMREYFVEKAKPNIQHVSNFLQGHPMMEKEFGLDEDHKIVDRKDWETALELFRTDSIRRDGTK